MKLEVLNVDDDKMVLFIHEKMMIHTGFSHAPKSFDDGYETLDYISKHKSSDKMFLIFLDVNMPNLDGWTFLGELDKKGLASYCYVLVITSSIEHTDKDKALTYDAAIGFVEKPLSMIKLEKLKSIRELLPFFEQ